jgi:hypothetical protein
MRRLTAIMPSTRPVLCERARRDQGDLRAGDDRCEEVDGVGPEVRQRARAAARSRLSSAGPRAAPRAGLARAPLRRAQGAGVAEHGRDDAAARGDGKREM